MSRRYNFLDKLIMGVDAGLATLCTQLPALRQNPAGNVPDNHLSAEEKRESVGMMRVNHSGEVCAQALYCGQLVWARDAKTREMLMRACSEEIDHLAWTHERLEELNSHRSYLNVFWYFNAFLIGMVVAASGDPWSLGFVEETEHQVGEHLKKHLGRLSPQDQKSQAIVKQMHEDELRHGGAAHQAGSSELPSVIKKLMALHGRVMTTLAFYI